MKFSNFLFSGSRDPDDDSRLIDETLEEAKLSDRLGMDTIWLAEHHFDGICSYVDPVSFAAALATTTREVKIGFAVAQMSLHHPIRFAEQMSVIDNLSKGRLIVGLGRGTSHNVYDYQGYGIDPAEAQARLLEAEDVMLRAWTEENLQHCGEYFDIRLPRLRPKPYSSPHPPIIRACSGADSVKDMAREGRPFMMNVQSNAVTRERMDSYREVMRSSGYDEAQISANLAECWAWRNVYVADSDATAQAVAVPAFEDQIAFRKEMRERIYREQGVTISQDVGKATPARGNAAHAIICGNPDTVAREIEAIDSIGVGGLILQFRIGDMTFEQTAKSIELFMAEVAPRFH